MADRGKKVQGCGQQARVALLANNRERHAYALLFFILLCAVLLASLLELPPLTRQRTFVAQPDTHALRKALNRPDQIDINTAVAAELTCLPGIGEAKAQAILSYRAQHGAFASVEGLDNVPGISEGILSKIRHQVTVS